MIYLKNIPIFTTSKTLYVYNFIPYRAGVITICIFYRLCHSVCSRIILFENVFYVYQLSFLCTCCEINITVQVNHL